MGHKHQRSKGTAGVVGVRTSKGEQEETETEEDKKKGKERVEGWGRPQGVMREISGARPALRSPLLTLCAPRPPSLPPQHHCG